MTVNFSFILGIVVLSTLSVYGKAQIAAAPGILTNGQPQAAAASGVFVNGQQLSTSDLSQLEQAYGAVITPGQYWYDGVAGAYGCMGGPTKGSAIPGLQAAPLPATASNGNTGVFINGRELPTQDLMLLQQAIGSTIPPGRYWMQSDGSYGVEGNPTPVGTLATRGGGGGGGGGGGCSDTTSGGTTVCSGSDGFLSVTGEDSTGRHWTVGNHRRLFVARSLLRGEMYRSGSRNLLQQVISCPATQAGTLGASPGISGSTAGSLGFPGAPAAAPAAAATTGGTVVPAGFTAATPAGAVGATLGIGATVPSSSFTTTGAGTFGAPAPASTAGGQGLGAALPGSAGFNTTGTQTATSTGATGLTGAGLTTGTGGSVQPGSSSVLGFPSTPAPLGGAGESAFPAAADSSGTPGAVGSSPLAVAATGLVSNTSSPGPLGVDAQGGVLPGVLPNATLQSNGTGNTSVGNSALVG